MKGDEYISREEGDGAKGHSFSERHNWLLGHMRHLWRGCESQNYLLEGREEGQKTHLSCISELSYLASPRSPWGSQNLHRFRQAEPGS